MLGSILSLRYCLSDWSPQSSSQYAILHKHMEMVDLFLIGFLGACMAIVMVDNRRIKAGQSH